MMSISERRARRRGEQAAAELQLVEIVKAELPTASLEDIVALGVRIEAHLAPLREVIGPAIEARETQNELTRRRVDVAAAEVYPIVRHLTEAQDLLVERATVLAAERGLAF